MKQTTAPIADMYICYTLLEKYFWQILGPHVVLSPCALHTPYCYATVYDTDTTGQMHPDSSPAVK